MWLWIKDSVAMFLLLIIFTVAWFFMSLVPPAKADDHYVPIVVIEVQSVLDGDTFEMKSGERVRLWGIDAPEIDAAHGYASKATLESLLMNADIQCGRFHYRSYNRAVMRCWTVIGFIDIGSWMVATGMARDWPNYSDGAYYDDMERALKACLGIWSDYCI